MKINTYHTPKSMVQGDRVKYATLEMLADSHSTRALANIPVGEQEMNIAHLGSAHALSDTINRLSLARKCQQPTMAKVLCTPIGLASHAVLAIALLINGCKDNAYPAPAPVALPAEPALGVLRPSETITYTPLSSPIGKLPAGETKEAPATTSAAKSAVSKTDQSTAMPLPGQANDHSVLLPNGSQKPKNSP